MYRDVFSTVTMAGAYLEAVRTATESDLRHRRNCQGNRLRVAKRRTRTSLFSRLMKALGVRLGRQRENAGVQTPAE